MSFTLATLITHINKLWKNDILVVTKLNRCLGTQTFVMYNNLKTPAFLNFENEIPKKY